MVDVLIIAAHPDDAELGMGGAISRLKEEGKSVGVVDLTSGEPTPRGNEERRSEETRKASEVLGLDWRLCLQLPNRSLESTLDARRKLAGVIRQQRPEVLFTHFQEDAHPDHWVASTVSDASRFWSKLSKTDLPGKPHWPSRVIQFYSMHLRSNPRPSFILDVSPYFDRKVESLECYQSQFIEGKPTGTDSFIATVCHHARYWGSLIGARYGEPFGCREELGLSSFRDIL